MDRVAACPTRSWSRRGPRCRSGAQCAHRARDQIWAALAQGTRRRSSARMANRIRTDSRITARMMAKTRPASNWLWKRRTMVDRHRQDHGALYHHHAPHRPRQFDAQPGHDAGHGTVEQDDPPDGTPVGVEGSRHLDQRRVDSVDAGAGVQRDEDPAEQHHHDDPRRHADTEAEDQERGERRDRQCQQENGPRVHESPQLGPARHCQSDSDGGHDRHRKADDDCLVALPQRHPEVAVLEHELEQPIDGFRECWDQE